MKILITILVFVAGKCKVSYNEIYKLSKGMEDFLKLNTFAMMDTSHTGSVSNLDHISFDITF